MSVLSYKRYLIDTLLTDSSERRLIETQSVNFSISDSFTTSETIVIGSEHSLKVNADVAETLDALDQSALKKLSIRAHCNKQAMYKASTQKFVPLSEEGVAETSKTE